MPMLHFGGDLESAAAPRRVVLSTVVNQIAKWTSYKYLSLAPYSRSQNDQSIPHQFNARVVLPALQIRATRKIKPGLAGQEASCVG